MDKYQEECRIGDGTFGIVLKARIKSNGQLVAIKKILLLDKDRLQITRELCSLRCLAHPNIIKFIDVFSSTDTLSIVMEFVAFHLNDIFMDIRRPKDDNFTKYFYQQILMGVAYIHSQNIMHRDLKPENILISSTLVAKIADFGHACLYDEKDLSRNYEIDVATRWYRAPELLLSYSHYTPSVDIWALGCICAQFVTSTALFQGRSDIEQLSKVFRLLGTPSEQSWPSFSLMPDASKFSFQHVPPMDLAISIGVGASTEFVRFLSRHLQLDGLRRASAEDLLNDRFIRSFSGRRPVYRVEKSRRSYRSRPLLLGRRR